MSKDKKKKPLNLSMDTELIKESKIQAVRDDVSISEWAEDAFRDKLAKKGIKLKE